jgi:hypothetical protein
LTVKNAMPSSGRLVPIASQALANASPKRGEMPMTSPVDFISGPSSVSSPGNLRKGKTGALMKKSTGGRSGGSPRDSIDRPAARSAAARAMGTPMAFETNGTVREALGLTSRT